MFNLENTALLALFAIGFFVAIYFESSDRKKLLVLSLVCLVLAIGAGYRSFFWMDTFKYLEFFLSDEYTPTLSDYSLSSGPKGYDERGFHLLSVIIKSFTKDVQIYFLVISSLTMFFLYKDLRKYSLYPVLGLFCYISRFYCGRNLIQIRAALSYAIILWGLQYIYKKDLLRFLIVIFFAYNIHHSALIAVPFYFIHNYLPLKRNYLLVGLAVAFVLGAFFQGPISSFVTDTAYDFNVATSYVQGGYVSKAQGLANPMIYFQTFILLVYVYLEKKLAPRYKYYYVFRNGYWYSTLILITFCSFTALSGRTSSQFATLEFAIIPSLIFYLPKSYRLISLFVTCGILTYFLWRNMITGMWVG